MTEADEPNGEEIKPDESADNRYVEITEPVRLPEGQNFYDQYPFREVISEVAGAYRGDEMVPDLRYAVSAVLRVVAQDEERARAQGGQIPDRAERLQVLLRRKDGVRELLPITTRRKYPLDDLSGERDLANAVTKVFQGLEQFPDWQTYILESNRSGPNGMYRPDGAPSTNVGRIRGMRPEYFPLSYLAWIDNRVDFQARLAGGLMLEMLKETFPQQLQGQSVIQAVPEIGDRRASRTWRVTRATGITGTR